MLRVDVVLDPAAGDRPVPGTPVRVELRDTSLADAPARVLARAEAAVAEDASGKLASVELPAPDSHLATPPTVWAHVDVAWTGSVTVGDYVTMQSHPVPPVDRQVAPLVVTVQPVR